MGFDKVRINTFIASESLKFYMVFIYIHIDTLANLFIDRFLFSLILKKSFNDFYNYYRSKLLYYIFVRHLLPFTIMLTEVN